MRILFVNSGLPGVPEGYARSIRVSLQEDLNCPVREISPLELNARDIIAFRPELVFVLHGNLTTLGVINFARKRGVRTALWIIEDPYELDVHTRDWLTAYDFVFTNELKAVAYYRKRYFEETFARQYCRGRGVKTEGRAVRRFNVYYLPWCTNPAVYHPQEVSKRYRSDLCFVGMGFQNRVKILNQLAGYLASLRLKLIGNWQDWGAALHPALMPAVIPGIEDPREIARYYCGASINLNIHRDPLDQINVNSAALGAESLNNRTFDIAGTGGFQLIDNTRGELNHFYNIGREIVTFSSPEELLARIKYYLKHPEERRQIGENAYFRTVNYHTFKKRLEKVLWIIKSGGEDY